MKIICKSATQVPGRGIVSKGEHIDWPDGVPYPPQVAGNFVEVGTGAALRNKDDAPAAKSSTREPTPEETAAENRRAETLAKDALVKSVAALGREKLVAALDQAGAAYKAKATCEELAKTLLRAQGQDVD